MSSILPYSTSLAESKLRPNRKNVACNTNLVVPNLVTLSTRDFYSSFTATSKEHKLNRPRRGSSSSNCKQNITTSGVDHVRERLLKREVSGKADQRNNLIFNNRPPQPRYMFAWSVESVIKYIKTKWKKNENLSEKYCLISLWSHWSWLLLPGLLQCTVLM